MTSVGDMLIIDPSLLFHSSHNKGLDNKEVKHWNVIKSNWFLLPGSPLVC